MSAHPQQGGHYDDGYGHPQGTDSYYQDDHNQGYYDQHNGYHDQQPAGYGNGHQNGDGYYDESCVAQCTPRFVIPC